MFPWPRCYLLVAASLCVPGTCSRSVPCPSVWFPGVTAPARESSAHRVCPLCSSSTEPAFCFIHKITPALIQFGHFTCLQTEPTARQVLTPRGGKLSKLGKPCIILKLRVHKCTHSRTCTHTHQSLLFQAAIQASYSPSNILSQSCLSLYIIITQEYHAHSSSYKHKLIPPAQTLLLNPADEVSYKK